MQKKMGKIGTIRKELEGRPCPACGSPKYQLVLRCDQGAQGGGLIARCSHCHQKREIEREDLEAMPTG